MPDAWTLAAAVAVLSIGTYLFRWAGPALPESVTSSKYAKDLINNAALLLLVGVMATSAATQDEGFAGPARLVAVAVAGLLAWRKAPFVVVILVAAACAAACRLVGLS